jgi:hypothetical protein
MLTSWIVSETAELTGISASVFMECDVKNTFGNSQCSKEYIFPILSSSSVYP